MPLGPEEIYLYARHAGFSPDQAVTMTAVAMAESGGVLTAHNPTGEDSRGLWQVNLEAHPKFHGLDASDPLTNARMAFEVSGGGADIGRWTVTHGDKGAPYLKFRDQAEAASATFGENGHGNWNPPANYHSAKQGAGVGGGPPPPADLPTVLPDDGDADFTPAFGGEGGNLAQSPTAFAQQPGAATAQTPTVDPDADVGQDSDGDGLLDRYEKAIGTDAHSLDSDNDGFTDRDEIIEFRTDATDFGSNPLGATGGSAPVGQVPVPAPPIPIPHPNAPGSPADDLSDVGVAPDLSDVGVAPGASPAGPIAAQHAAAQPVNLLQSQTFQTAGPSQGGLVPGQAQGGGNTLDVFLDAAVAQDGKPYVFGAEAAGDDLDPDALDCSELVEWAGTQAGVKIPDGSFNQYLHSKGLGGEMTVEEALQTPGALLFKFSSTPVAGGGRPSTAHVAISLGDGRTIEARNSRVGTGIMDAGDIEWTHAGVVPELGTELSGDFGPGVVTEPVQPILMGTDSDEDGLLDAYEQLIGTDPFNADTDQDGFIDSAEIHEHHSDPLDFTDNALTPGASGGYRPPLTTDLAPGQAGQPSPFAGVGSAPGSGSGSPFGQGGSGGGGQGGGGGTSGSGSPTTDDVGQAPGSTEDNGQPAEPAQPPEPAEPPEPAADAEEEPAAEAEETLEEAPEEAGEAAAEAVEEFELGEALVPHDVLAEHPDFLEAIEDQDLDFDLDADGDVDEDDFGLHDHT